VSGSWQVTAANHLVFTPATSLIEGTYTLSANIQDRAGNAVALNSRFTFDATPPALPTFNPVTSPTNSNTQIVGGTKEAGSSIWINGAQVVPLDPGTTWSYSVPLQPGANTITAFSQDRAGNRSGSVSVEITFDDIAPLPVTALTVDARGNGTSARLDWSGYDETVHGDIAGYRVYSASQVFTNVSGLTPVATLPAGTRTHEITGLTKGQSYYFAVVAYDSNNNVNTSVTPVTATPTDILPPEDVTGVQVTVQANALTVSWTPSADSQGDLAGYRFYFNNDAGTSLGASATSRNVTGLVPATSYPVRITALDTDGNESTGVSLVELSWNPVQPAQYVKNYAIYASTTDFASVEGMTPRLLVNGTKTTARLAGLTNNTTYYFAITAINTSDGERKTVTTVSDTPVPDTQGPVITNLRYNGVPLASGATVTTAGEIALDASDPSGIGRVEFQVDGAPLAIDTNTGDGIAARWNIVDTTDGNRPDLPQQRPGRHTHRCRRRWPLQCHRHAGRRQQHPRGHCHQPGRGERPQRRRHHHARHQHPGCPRRSVRRCPCQRRDQAHLECRHHW